MAVETWSVIVKGKKGLSSKEVVKKELKEVFPTFGVRVHEFIRLLGPRQSLREPK